MKENPVRNNTVFVLAIRIWIIHVIDILMYIFSLYICVPIFGDNTALICASIFAPVCYLIFGYMDSWSFGQNDMNKVIYGRIRHDKLKAVKGCIISQIPGIILAILHICRVDSVLAQTLLTYFYMGFSYEIKLTSDSFRAFALIPAVMPFICVLPGYYMGYHQKRISDKLVYTTKKKDLR